MNPQVVYFLWDLAGLLPKHKAFEFLEMKAYQFIDKPFSISLVPIVLELLFFDVAISLWLSQISGICV